MAKSNKRLGRGLASLVSSTIQADEASVQPVIPPEPRKTAPKSEKIVPEPPKQNPKPASGPRLINIQVDSIRANPNQPRRNFDPNALEALAYSLKHQGTLQPIVVRPSDTGYELVAGERRWRASKMAGLNEIPAIVRPVKDQQMLELALIENILREDLNPIERAKAYKALQVKYTLSHDEIAQKTGEDRVTITNYLRILALNEEIQQMISAGEIGAGHAKVLLGVSEPALQLKLAKQAARDGWSVRQVEAAVRRAKTAALPKPVKVVRPVVQDMVEQLTASIGTAVKIQEGRKKNTGKIVIEYYSLDDFERISDLLGASNLD